MEFGWKNPSSTGFFFGGIFGLISYWFYFFNSFSLFAFAPTYIFQFLPFPHDWVIGPFFLYFTHAIFYAIIGSIIGLIIGKIKK